MTLSEAFEAYRTEVIVLKGQSLRTEEGFLVSKRVICRAFSDTDITLLSPSDVRKWHLSLHDRGLSINTIRGYVFNLKSVLRYCALNGHKVFDPELITAPKRENKIPDYITRQEFDLIIKSIKPKQGGSRIVAFRDRAIVALLYASALRASELLSLDRKDFDKGKATIVGKGNKVRLVLWDKRAAWHLQEYLRVRTDSSPALFVSQQGSRMDRHALTTMFIRLQKTMGMPHLHAHSLRHGCATRLISAGMPIHAVQHHLGHANISTTSIYLHLEYPQYESEYQKYANKTLRKKRIVQVE